MSVDASKWNLWPPILLEACVPNDLSRGCKIRAMGFGICPGSQPKFRK